MCFSHLFGFALSLMILRVTTPVFTASSIRNSSIFWALISLSSVCIFSTSLNFWWNSTVLVCARHFCALMLYSCISSPCYHLFTVTYFLLGCVAGGLSWLGCGVVAGVWWVAGACYVLDSGIVVYKRSWSVILSSCCWSCCTCN